MTGRQLTRAQRDQRRNAAVKSGAHSAAKTRPRAAVLYGRLRRRVARADGPTTPTTRMRLRLLATALARLEAAEAWLAEQDDELFADVTAGTLHGIHASVDRWANAAAALIDKLPEGSADRFDGLAGLAARGRRR